MSYRWRTRLRGILPHRPPLYRLVPKGRDCGAGNHELYRHRGEVWRCYHCRRAEVEGGGSWADLLTRSPADGDTYAVFCAETGNLITWGGDRQAALANFHRGNYPHAALLRFDHKGMCREVVATR